MLAVRPASALLSYPMTFTTKTRFTARLAILARAPVLAYMRIYDKVKEKLQKTGEAVVDENSVPISHLTRFEIECHDEAADFAMRTMAATGARFHQSDHARVDRF